MGDGRLHLLVGEGALIGHHRVEDQVLMVWTGGHPEIVYGHGRIDLPHQSRHLAPHGVDRGIVGGDGVHMYDRLGVEFFLELPLHIVDDVVYLQHIRVHGHLGV